MKFSISEQDKASLCRQAPEFELPIRQFEVKGFEYGDDLFSALVQSVVSQQLSVRAAETIHGRVEKLLVTVNPANVMGADETDLRSCGLSARKVEYLRGIADAVLSGAVDFAEIAEMDDAGVTAELTKLKGVGVWTAEMLLIFALGRRDVLSFSDLGIRRGLMLLNNLETLTDDDQDFYRRRYSPYGTLASLYLWRIKDNRPSVR